MMMNREAIQRAYEEIGQGHVFQFYDDLSEAEKQNFLKELSQVNSKEFSEILNKTTRHCGLGVQHRILAADVISLPKTASAKSRFQIAYDLGLQTIKEGQVACFVVAGGQGSRLGYEGPKGAFCVGLPSGRSLFEIQANQILAASQHYGVDIPWYIMTSQTNHDETVKFFKDHSYFSIKPSLINFFMQDMLPAVDKNGKMILAEKNHLFLSPNGHGGSLLALEKSGALLDMKRRGIKYLSYYQVDNILIEIIDPLFIGLHILENSDFSFKMVRKRNAEEKVGVVAQRNGKLEVIEYSDLPQEEMYALDEKGEQLKFWAGSIAIHMFSVNFIKNIVKDGFQLPYHIAEKTIPFINAKGEKENPAEKNGIKYESFVFDAVQFTKNVMLLEVVREDEFGPVKNKEGEDSPKSACELYMDKCRRQLLKFVKREDLKDKILRAKVVEISPLRAYSEQEWQDLALNLNNSLDDFLYF